MAISVGGEGSAEKPLSDINTTPLVDVMLVMLIIFLIAVPVAVHSVKVKLPEVRYDPTTTKPENISLAVRGGPGGSCEVYWNLTKVSSEELLDRATKKLKADIERLGGESAITPDNLPEAHIRGDVDTPYKCIGGTIFTMQRAGYPKVGFISQPPPGSAIAERL